MSRGVENLLTMPSNPQCLLFGKRWTPFQFTLVVFIFLVLFNEYFIYVFQTMRWPNVPDINRYVLICVLRFYFSCIYYCDDQTIMITWTWLEIQEVWVQMTTGPSCFLYYVIFPPIQLHLVLWLNTWTDRLESLKCSTECKMNLVSKHLNRK